DWSSDVCSSDLVDLPGPILECFEQVQLGHERADVAHASSSTFARAAAGASGSSGGGDHAAIAPRRERPTRRGGGSPWRRAAPPSGPTGVSISRACALYLYLSILLFHWERYHAQIEKTPCQKARPRVRGGGPGRRLGAVLHRSVGLRARHGDLSGGSAVQLLGTLGRRPHESGHGHRRPHVLP